MAEAYFVIKVFIVSCVLVFVMQYRVGGRESAEQQILGFIHNSKASKWMTDAGTGAVRLTASVTNKVVDTNKIANALKVDALSETPEQRMQRQLEQAKKQEEEMLRRVEQAVDGYPAD